MTRYAEKTTVTSEASRAEIERTLVRYGADAFVYGWEEGGAMIQFRMNGRFVRFLLPLPDRNAREFTHSPTRHSRRSEDAAAAAWEQAARQRWRALALVVKAKLEAVAAGITEFDDEFLAHLVLPNGTTVGRNVRAAIESAYETGRMPRSILALPAAGETS